MADIYVMSTSAKIREIMRKDPTITVSQTVVKLKKEGFGKDNDKLRKLIYSVRASNKNKDVAREVSSAIEAIAVEDTIPIDTTIRVRKTATSVGGIRELIAIHEACKFSGTAPVEAAIAQMQEIGADKFGKILSALAKIEASAAE